LTLSRIRGEGSRHRAEPTEEGEEEDRIREGKNDMGGRYIRAEMAAIANKQLWGV